MVVVVVLFRGPRRLPRQVSTVAQPPWWRRLRANAPGLTGKVLGTIGFWYPNDWPEPEIKWALARRHWGKGFAAEAVRAVQSAGREYLPDIHLISLIHADNEASIRLAKAVGARFERETTYGDWPCHIYRHPAAAPVK